MNVYFIRHTEVDVPQGVCYGRTDVPLKTSFEIEAQSVKCKLEHIEPDAVFSSPLSRCTRLANYCGFEKIALDNRLMELDFGTWENRRWNDLDMSVWEVDWINNPAPEGESFIDMYWRVAGFLDELKNNEYQNVAIFTHGGVIHCARVYFEQTNIHETFNLKPKYGEIIKFT